LQEAIVQGSHRMIVDDGDREFFERSSNNSVSCEQMAAKISRVSFTGFGGDRQMQWRRFG
jgi:catabolite regulation protein CreA